MVEERKIFSRKRKSIKQRALGMLLYFAGLSYEKEGMFAGASYEAVREWYQKGKELFEQSTVKKKRKQVAVDEKELTINGTTIFIWGAVDLDDEKVIAVWVSFGRSAIVIVIDNFSSHKSMLVKDTAKTLGIHLVFLPPYSPDINPIEYIWKSVKRVLSLSFVKTEDELPNFHPWL